MEFTFETEYNAKALAAMAKGLRKTIRKKHSRRSHIFGWIVTVLGILLVIADFALDFRTVITSLAILMIFLVLLFEDRINGWVAKKRLLPGTEKATAVFTEEEFVSTTEVGTTQWRYDKILLLGETADYFVFIFSMSHAQVYDKRSITGGTAEEFRGFIEERTGKKVQAI